MGYRNQPLQGRTPDSCVPTLPLARGPPCESGKPPGIVFSHHIQLPSTDPRKPDLFGYIHVGPVPTPYFLHLWIQNTPSLGCSPLVPETGGVHPAYSVLWLLPFGCDSVLASSQFLLRHSTQHIVRPRCTGESLQTFREVSETWKPAVLTKRSLGLFWKPLSTV